MLDDALPAAENEGTFSIFYDQVAHVGSRYHWPITDLLALTMAHEIGHLLLPAPAHSDQGIMRGEWDGDDVRGAVLDDLRFTSEEAGRMREKIGGCPFREGAA